MRPLACCLVLVISSAPSSVALADEVVGPTPVAAGKNATVAEGKEKPARPVLYIEDWGRLAEISQADASVFSQADFWAARRAHSVQIATTGLLLGGSVATAGTVVRLAADHWTNATKWSVAGGLSMVIVSVLTAWAIAPDRSDLLTVINDWNLRHPDRPLAP